MVTIMVPLARIAILTASLLGGVGHCLANPPSPPTDSIASPSTPPAKGEPQSNDARTDPGRGLLNLPWRVNARCRYGVVREQERVQRMYRVFVTTDSVNNADWCEMLERYLRTHCDEKRKDENGEWMKDIAIDFTRCDNDAKDTYWEKGSIATFKYSRWQMDNNLCVTSAVIAAAAGAKVDWMGGQGCHEQPIDESGQLPR